ncbi:MAG: LacI family DNA-binding transcriptional regulator [Phycisphaerae bacterium]|nr:LacI family DNA-binding transcriptional regulator [Phycisphaerae bacterium]
MATLQDVAELAKVSKSTVSLAINDSPLIKSSTRKKVLAAIKAVGYRPNISAQRLKGGSSMTIGVLVSNVENPFFAELLRGIEKVLDAANYLFFIGSTHDDAERESLFLDRMYARGVDALIVVPAAKNGAFYEEFSSQNKMPIVMVSRILEKCRIDTVLADNFGGAYTLGKKIASLRRRVISLDSDQNNYTSFSRLAGLRQALAEEGITLSEDNLYKVKEFTIDVGREAARKIDLSGQEPMAIFAINDMLALGIIKELKKKNVRIPEQVAVFGFDGLDFLRMGVFDISSMKVPAAALGEQAAKLVLEKIKEGGESWFTGNKILVPVEYIDGDSGGISEETV